jgi:hypothetical protein
MDERSPPEHANVTMPICMWCGQEHGSIIIGKRLVREADKWPRNVVFDAEPCTSCQEKMAQGITAIEVTDVERQSNGFEINPGYYMTGRWAVLTEEGYNQWHDWFKVQLPPAALEKQEQLHAHCLKVRKFLCVKAMYEAINPTLINDRTAS